MKCYISSNGNGVEEVTEFEYTALFGNDETRPYATKVYCDEIIIDDVPEELRETVQEIVNNKIARFGKYESTAISPIEFQTMLEEAL